MERTQLAPVVTPRGMTKLHQEPALARIRPSSRGEHHTTQLVGPYPSGWHARNAVSAAIAVRVGRAGEPVAHSTLIRPSR
jgi:hypothetical protein